MRWHVPGVKFFTQEPAMPVVRVSLLKGKSPEYLKALSDSVQRAMVETFNVPPRDRFMIIHQHEPHELIFDRTYLAGPRSDDFVLLAISVGKPRSEDVRKAFFKRLVELLGQSPACGRKTSWSSSRRRRLTNGRSAMAWRR